VYSIQGRFMVELLGFQSSRHRRPAFIAPFAAEPVVLGVGQQRGRVLWRTENIKAQRFSGSGHEGAAMGMGFAVGDRIVDNLARAPFYGLPREPVVLNVHLIECFGQVLTRRCNRDGGPSLLSCQGDCPEKHRGEHGFANDSSHGH